MKEDRGQRRSRRSVQEEEGRYRSLVENSLEGIALSQDGKLLFANPAFLRMYGYDRLDEIAGRSIADLVAPESRDYVLNLSRQREAGAEVPSHYEFRGIRKDGALIDVEVQAVRVTYEGRVAVQGTFWDVTERKRLGAELKASAEALQRRNAQLATLNSAVRDLSGLFDMHDLHAAFVEHIRGSIPFDHAAVSLLEDERHFRHLATGEVVTAPGIIGEAGSATDWVVKHRQPMIRQDLLTDGRFRVSDRTRSTGIRSDVIIPLISRGRVVGTMSLGSCDTGAYQEADMEFLQPLASQLAVSVDNARLYRDLNRAYDDLKAMQAQVVEAEKLRALAEMSGGVAHNFNNLLTGILGYAQLLQMNHDAALHEHGLQVIEKNAREGARITREMQEFARAQSERPFGPIDLNRVVQRSLAATELRWRDEPASRGIKIEVKTLLGDIPVVEGDEVGLGKVVSNLILNAVEAMPTGGTITVATEATDESQKQQRMEGAERTSYIRSGGGVASVASVAWVVLRVSDTGTGMGVEQQGRIFEPFFTTKGPQVGHGLGLSVAYGIILRHQGRIEVASELKKGTTFTVWLPAMTREAEWKSLSNSPVEGLARVLIIDDDGMARDVLARMLKMCKVEVAKDGRQGLALFERGRHEIVITDLGMPGLNGWDVAKAVKHAAPKTRVILMTAWDVTVSAQQLRQNGVDEVLKKPFGLEQIHQVLARVRADRIIEQG